MYSFKSDYSEGAHPRILKALMETNFEQADGYGEDPYTWEAIQLLKQRIACSDADIHFISGGTQTNLIAMAAFLRPHEAVIAPFSGHVAVHEAGAIEATGHKVITTEGKKGKLRPADVEQVLHKHNDEHMVKPRLVYISNSTEIGTIYNRAELTALSQYCRDRDLLLFIDGARLGAALTAAQNDLSLEDIARLTDAFYIGGTKNGALLGEALIIRTGSLQEDFRFHLKQRGALLAKGRLLGIQFRELFSDDLFFELARHANRLAQKIQLALGEAGVSFLVPSPSNQIFPILPNDIIKELLQRYSFHIWDQVSAERSVIRLITSWATKEEAVERFIFDLKRLL
ncbi:MAG: aminotransferase class V-fold PLP-dependent enzyme [Firmicutes bacterium]|nr:aminotransferase class V-fold PLP-dependent enzyme [Bacillota bacterium]